MPEVKTIPEVLILGKQHPKLVTDLKSFSNIHELQHIADPEEFLSTHGSRIRGVATNNFTGFPSRLFEKLPSLEIIGSFGVGVDSIDVEGAKSRGIVVTNTPDVLTDDVADLALALMLSVSRQICVADRYVREGLWVSKGFMPLTTKVSGKRVGIVGLGRIGLAIAKRAEAFDCSIAYFGRSPKTGIPYRFYDNLVALAGESDFLVIACPLTPATTHIINPEVLEALGPKGVLVNIARGPVVDEKALVSALLQGRLGGAGLDVFEKEPEVSEELTKLDNVVLLPHVGSATHETRQDMADLTVENLRAYFEGRPLPSPV